MTSPLASRRARRRWITYTVLLVVTVLLMAFSSNPAVREVQRGFNFALKPVQGAVSGAADSIASVFGAIGEIDRLRLDNAALRDQNAQLANANARLELLRRENDQLTGLLQLQNGFDHATVAARVIGRETLPTIRMVTLDKGTDDGLALGDVVIVQGGALAGRISDIGPTFAKVTLLSDSTLVVIGQLLTSSATGEISGDAGGVLVMKNIDASVAISLDEEVYTAGLELAGGIRSPYPRGLVIGTVVDVQRDATDVVQTAFIQPAADLAGFSLALVITDYSGGLPLVDASAAPASATPSSATPSGKP